MAGLLTCALTGLLISPISWDHHWVWIVPAVVVAAHYAARARRAAARWAAGALAAGVAAIFGAWPGSLWGQPHDLGAFSQGFIWVPPNTSPGTYFHNGDQPWYAEYHWRSLDLIAGNLYVLTGMALFVMLLVLAARAARTMASARITASARTMVHAPALNPERLP